MIQHVQYIKHSCFFVELNNSILLFDYFMGDLSKLPKNKPIYAFASHFHQDHFSFQLFDALKDFPNVTYILSNDIKRRYNKKFFMKHGIDMNQYDTILFLSHDQNVTVGNLSICTLKSTDSGVAFLITTEHSTIYHAGDLNWWTWKGESQEKYETITHAFKTEIKKMEGMHIDLAFLPLDPNQEERFYLGFDYFMNHIDVTTAYAMHCWDRFSIVDKLLAMDCSKNYRDKIRYR